MQIDDLPNYLLRLRVIEPDTDLTSLCGKVRRRGFKQTLAVTFALRCQFEDSFGQSGLEHCGYISGRARSAYDVLTEGSGEQAIKPATEFHP